jgi:D-tyrosyl-tRNA(Tyr) deacylase
MKAVLQRVSKASVTINKKKYSEIKKGYVIMLGIAKGDTKKEADKLFRKIIGLRLFENEDNHFDKEIEEINGEILVISQFTLFAEYKKGKRPYFGDAEEPKSAMKLYEYFIEKCKEIYNKNRIRKGLFGAKMEVEIINSGPVTIILDSKEL